MVAERRDVSWSRIQRAAQDHSHCIGSHLSAECGALLDQATRQFCVGSNESSGRYEDLNRMLLAYRLLVNIVRQADDRARRNPAARAEALAAVQTLAGRFPTGPDEVREFVAEAGLSAINAESCSPEMAGPAVRRVLPVRTSARPSV